MKNIIKVIFPKISEAKIKVRIFVGPYIRQVIYDKPLNENFNDRVKPVSDNFLENVYQMTIKLLSRNF